MYTTVPYAAYVVNETAFKRAFSNAFVINDQLITNTTFQTEMHELLFTNMTSRFVKQ